MPTVYVTPEELEEHLGEDEFLALTDRDADGGSDTAAVSSALSKASALVDGYISRKLPASGVLPVVPEWLKQATIDLAVYYIVDFATDTQEKKHDDALRVLRDVAAGRLDLGVPLASSQLEAEIEILSPEHVMCRDSLGRIL
jgi:phage gp36-like protein